jgi:hypothetical protein
LGYFGKFVYSNERWSQDAGGHVYLSIDIHDSDFATITYSPAVSGKGVCYLGMQPRDYFADTTASEPVDVAAEASGLAIWARQTLDQDVDIEALRPLLAQAGDIEPQDDFVEKTVHRFLDLLHLPVPEGLPPSS